MSPLPILLVGLPTTPVPALMAKLLPAEDTSCSDAPPAKSADGLTPMPWPSVGLIALADRPTTNQETPVTSPRLWVLFDRVRP